MPRTETVRALEHEVGVLIRRVRRAIGERARLVHPDLQPMSYLILAHLAEAGPMRSSALAETFGADKGAVSRQVQHLSNLGLLVRAPDPEDGRATLLSPSDDARRRLDEVRQQRRRRLDERLGDWSDDDLDTLVTALGRYNRTLS
jgi:DNA-binding MarR family transcriptional regulator